MLQPAPGIRVFLACGTTDMRKGFDGLAAQVQMVLAQDAHGGALFAFRGRRGDLIKLLWCDRAGPVTLRQAAGTQQVRLATGRQRRGDADRGAAVDAVGRDRLAHAGLDGTAHGYGVADIAESELPGLSRRVDSWRAARVVRQPRCRDCRAAGLAGRARCAAAEQPARDRLEEDQAQADAAARQRSRPPQDKPRQQPVRKPLPEHLPRGTILHEPVLACRCGSIEPARLTRLGEDVTEVLEKIPARLKVIRHVRPRYACRSCEMVLQAPAPDLPVERGRPGPGLLAHVLVSKYVDGLPLYRLAGILAREGVEIERKTLADWVGRGAWWLRPLAEAIGRHAMAQQVIWTDDTPIRVLAPCRGKTRQARFWVYAHDPRLWPGAVDEQRADMPITPLADPTEPLPLAARMLLWNDPQLSRNRHRQGLTFRRKR